MSEELSSWFVESAEFSSWFVAFVLFKSAELLSGSVLIVSVESF